MSGADEPRKPPGETGSQEPSTSEHSLQPQESRSVDDSPEWHLNAVQSPEAGEQQSPPHLRSVTTPEPPEPPLPPGGAGGARVERLRLENDSIRAQNEHVRAVTKKLEQETTANITIQKAASKAKNKGLETDREDRHVERYLAMAVLIFGMILAVAAAPGAGLLLSIVGVLRLRALTPNKKPLLWWKREEDKEAGQ